MGGFLGTASATQKVSPVTTSEADAKTFDSTSSTSDDTSSSPPPSYQGSPTPTARTPVSIIPNKGNNKAIKNPSTAQNPPGGGGFLHSVTFRLIILVWFCIQNTAHILLISYTRTRDVPEVYYPEVATFMVEVFKLLFCVPLLFIEAGGNLRTVAQMTYDQMLSRPLDTLKIGVPSLLYTVQNIVLYYAASHLSATAFMITQQLKLMAAAIFSVLILRRRLTVLHWTALCTLLAGVTVVQMASAHARRHTVAVGEQIPALGFALTVMGCVMSGFSGVLLEKIYKKGRDTSIWMRNVQMSVFMIPISLCFVVGRDYTKIMETRFLYGFDWVLWFQMFWLTIGGLTAGACIKFADTITKDMAISMGIVLATVSSMFLFHFTPSLFFVAGAALVISAIFLYSYSSRIMEAVELSTSGFTGVMAFGPRRGGKHFEQGPPPLNIDSVEQRWREKSLSRLEAFRHQPPHPSDLHPPSDGKGSNDDSHKTHMPTTITSCKGTQTQVIDRSGSQQSSGSSSSSCSSLSFLRSSSSSSPHRRHSSPPSRTATVNTTVTSCSECFPRGQPHSTETPCTRLVGIENPANEKKKVEESEPADDEQPVVVQIERF